MRFKKHSKSHKRSFSKHRRFVKRKGMTKLSALRQTTGIYNLKPAFETTKSVYTAQLVNVQNAGGYDLIASLDLAALVVGEQFTNLWRTYNSYRLLSVTVDMVWYAQGASNSDNLARNGPIQAYWSTLARPGPVIPNTPVYLPHQGAKIFRPPGLTGSKFRFKCVPTKGTNIYDALGLGTANARAGKFGFLQLNQEFAFWIAQALPNPGNFNIGLLELTYNWYAWDKGNSLNPPVNGVMLDFPSVYRDGNFALRQAKVDTPWTRNVEFDLREIMQNQRIHAAGEEMTIASLPDDEECDEEFVKAPDTNAMKSVKAPQFFTQMKPL